VVAVAIAVGGYVEFKFSLSAEERETEWLRRVGNAGGRDVDRLGVAGPAHVAWRWEGLPDFRGILIQTKSGRVTFECWKTGN